jgi:SAM-dependent methyltransferase
MTSHEDPYEVLTAYQKSAAVMAAAKSGLFDALNDTPKNAHDIATPIGLDEYATTVLLDALAACGYVERTEEGSYMHNAFSHAFAHDGNMARIVLKEAFFYEKWANLHTSVKTGKAQLEPFAKRCGTSPKEIQIFLSALNDIAAMGARGVLDAALLPDGGTLLDFGGGMGGYAVKIAKRYPGLGITLVDSPFVAGLCRRHLETLSLGGRIEVVDGDLFDLAPTFGSRKFDVVFVSHVIHDYPLEKAAKIIESAAKCVKVDGRLYVLDVPKPEPDGSAVEALFNVMMLVESPGGRTHDDAKIRSWIGATGLKVRKFTKLYFGALYEAR